MNNGIKECPFCGGKAKAIEARAREIPTFSVVCENCNTGIFSPRYNGKSWNGYASIEDAIEAWNRRSS